MTLAMYNKMVLGTGSQRAYLRLWDPDPQPHKIRTLRPQHAYSAYSAGNMNKISGAMCSSVQLDSDQCALHILHNPAFKLVVLKC